MASSTTDSGQSVTYQDFCRALNLDEDSAAAGWEQFCELQGLVEDVDNQHSLLLIASALFLSHYRSAGNGVKLDQLLHQAGAGFTDFVEYMSLLAQRRPPAPGVMDALKVLKERYIISSLMFQKLQSLWNQRHTLLGTGDSASTSRQESTLFCAVWYIFVLVRKAQLGDHADLVSSFHLLLASLYLVLAHGTPEGQSVCASNSASQEEAAAAALSAMAVDRDPLQANIVEITSVSQEALSEAIVQVIAFVRQLINDGTLTARDADEQSLGTVLSGHAAQNVTAMQRFYELHYLHTVADLDEQLFLEHDRHKVIGTPSKFRRAARRPVPRTGRELFRDPSVSSGDWPWDESNGGPHGASTQWVSPPSSAQSPARSPAGLRSPAIPRSPGPAQTPVSAAVAAMRWLRTVCPSHTGQVEPDEELERFFTACSNGNPREAIMQRMNNLLPAFSLTPRPLSLPGEEGDAAQGSRGPHSLSSAFSASSAGNDSAAKARHVGAAVYLTVLSRMLRSESVRLRTDDFSALLNNDTFHRALLACSMEVVLKAHSLVTLAFPRTLELLDVSPFDFYKVIESFVRHAEGIPKGLSRHMQELEVAVAERLAWTSDSPLLQLMEAAQERKREREAEAAAADGAAEGGAESTGAESTEEQPVFPRPVDLFLRKLLTLAASRIYHLCNKLCLGADIVDQVWTSVKYIVTERFELMRDRQLDQVILCTVYGLAKVNALRPEVTFKRIIDAYKTSPAAPVADRLQLIRHIPLRNPGEFGDIIRFYNAVFVSAMKSFLLQFQRRRAPGTPSSPAPMPGSPARPARRAQHAVGSPAPRSPSVAALAMPAGLASPGRAVSTNVFVSPRQHASSMTPRTRALYAFGESPGRDLRLINRAVNKRSASSVNRLFDGDVQSSPRKQLRALWQQRAASQSADEPSSAPAAAPASITPVIHRVSSPESGAGGAGGGDAAAGGDVEMS